MLPIFKRIVLCAFALTYATLLFPSHSSAANRDVCSTCTYTTVSAAVTAAVSGDVIRIAGGTYDTGYGIQGSKNLSFYGGYSNDFLTRDPSGNPSVLSTLSVSFHTGNLTFDGLTLVTTNSVGFYVYSAGTTITVNNCTISGVHLYDVGDVALTNNTLTPGASGYNVVEISSGWGSAGQLTIANNLISGEGCASCDGIYIGRPKSNDVIDSNTITGAMRGIEFLFASPPTTPLISNNTIANNSGDGVYVSAGSPIFEHNLIRDNGNDGIYIFGSTAAVFKNNVLARNSRGIYLSANNGTPDVRNNIFFENEWRGLEMSGSGGWGYVSTLPIAVNNNCFYHNIHGSLLHTALPVQSLRTEAPGSYDDLNSPIWADANFEQDPRFVDADNNNFHLAPDSFLIDEGDPTSDFSDEPAPNGARVNVGLEGNTSAAAVSPGAPTVANVAAAKSGSDVLVTFDTNTVLSAVWITLEYWNGASWSVVSPNTVSGTSYSAGYRTGRVGTGAGVALRILNPGTALGDSEIVNAKIRVTVEHAADSAQAESALFSGVFTPPTVSMTAPPAGIALTLPKPAFTATASDSDGIVSVKFYYKRSSDSTFTLLNTDTTTPYAAVWGNTSLAPGYTYDFQVEAVDTLDNAAIDAIYGSVYCSYAFVSPTINVSADASSDSGSIIVSDWQCAWSASSNASWLTTSSAMTGNGSVYFLASQNASSLPRTGTITVRGQTLTVTQAGSDCGFSLNASSVSHSANATGGSIALNANYSDCGWTAVSNRNWLTPAASGSGGGSVAFTMSPNTSDQARSGTITIGGREFVVTQNGVPCSFAVNHTALSVPQGGGSAEFVLTPTPSSCPWDASVDGAWLSLTPSSGNGTASVTVTAESNQFQRARAATLSIGGTAVVISQAGSPTRATITLEKRGASGGELSILGSSCGVDCDSISKEVDIGSVVTISAADDDGVEFARWIGGSCAKAVTCSVTVTADMTIGAVFTPPNQIALVIEIGGKYGNSVAVSPRGQSCGTGCYLYKSSRSKPKKITLTARSEKGSSFARWSGGCKGQSTSCRVELRNDTAVKAHFAEQRRRKGR